MYLTNLRVTRIENELVFQTSHNLFTSENSVLVSLINYYFLFYFYSFFFKSSAFRYILSLFNNRRSANKKPFQCRYNFKIFVCIAELSLTICSRCDQRINYLCFSFEVFIILQSMDEVCALFTGVYPQ